MTGKLAFLSAVLLLLCGCAALPPPENLELTEKDSSRTINVRKGAVIRIALDANPTTGYLWKQERYPDMEVLRLVEENFIAPDVRLAGAGGKKIYVFKAVDSGRAGIHLVYLRPWETKAPAKSFQLGVAVMVEKKPFADLFDLERGTKRVGSKGQIEPRRDDIFR